MMNRLNNEKMCFYKETYKKSEHWDGKKSLKSKTVIVYFEQGIGDTIQFLRYIKELKKHDCIIIVQCDPLIKCILPYVDGIDDFVSKKESVLPKHDLHILSLDLPYLLLNCKKTTLEDWRTGKKQQFYIEKINENIPTTPYINFHDKIDLGSKDKTIGICWEGNPNHKNNSNRSCPLKYFKNIKSRVFSLQKEIHQSEFTEQCEDFDLWGSEINDFEDTMRIINSVDFVITVDTSILHLAGSLNKKTFVLLSTDCDERWGRKSNKTLWYPSLTLIRQEKINEWESCFQILVENT